MITGYWVAPCGKCGATQPYLHLSTARPCRVRCGRCGSLGPESDASLNSDIAAQGDAVDKWNDEQLNGGGK